MPLRLTIVSSLFNDHTEQEVIIDEQIQIQRIISEIKREYRLPDSNYVLKTRDTGQVLPQNQTLAGAGVKTGTALLFELGTYTSLNLVGLRAANGHFFELSRFPALIGRPNPEKNITAHTLVVDLTPLDTDKSSSRPHARIVEQQGTYYVESLRADNPTYVNEKAVPLGTTHPLRPRDQLRFGKVKLQFEAE